MGFDNVDPEDIVIGRHESGVMLEEGQNTSTTHNYCTSCRRNRHCYVIVDRETKKADIKMTCSNIGCECRCRTHFACRRCGHLHPYGYRCDVNLDENIIGPKAEKRFEEIMKIWRDKTIVEKEDNSK